jgi:hypothetical protein
VSVRKASVEDADQLSRWVLRDFGSQSDFTGFFACPRNVCFIAGEGAAFFAWHGPGIYETHCCFDERGREVRDLSLTILQKMRDEHAARLIWAAIPNASRKVKIYARWLGFKSAGALDDDNELFTLENW